MIFYYFVFFFFSSRRRHTRSCLVSWARRCVQETGTWVAPNEPPMQTQFQSQGQRPKRASKWSDHPLPPPVTEPVFNPPPQNPNLYFDAGIIKINTGTPIPNSAITINNNPPDAVQSNLQNQQAKLFASLLTGNSIKLPPGAEMPIKSDSTFPEFPQSLQHPDGSQPFQILPGMNPNIINTLTDTSKIRRKIYVPKGTGFNYTGLIIGPRGSNQKRLEEETGCKILVRGKGSQKEGQPPQPDDDEDQHVLIVGDNEMQVAKAYAEIERIILADEETRTRIRQEQLKTVAQLKNDPSLLVGKSGDVDLSLTTPYGPPSQEAYIIPVPNDCVGLVIGKGGETIKQLQASSGAKKVQVAADSAPGSNTRNVFVEGDKEAYERCKRMITEIVEQQQRFRQATTGMMPNNERGQRVEMTVPNSYVGLIIGRQGETIKGINAKTGAVVFIPKESDQTGNSERLITISGRPDQVAAARQEIEAIIELAQRNQQMKAAQNAGMMPMGFPFMNPMMGGFPMAGFGGFDPNTMMAAAASGGDQAQAFQNQAMAGMMDPAAMAMAYQQMMMDPNMIQQMYGNYQNYDGGLVETVVDANNAMYSKSSKRQTCSKLQIEDQILLILRRINMHLFRDRSTQHTLYLNASSVRNSMKQILWQRLPQSCRLQIGMNSEINMKYDINRSQDFAASQSLVHCCFAITMILPGFSMHTLMIMNSKLVLQEPMPCPQHRMRLIRLIAFLNQYNIEWSQNKRHLRFCGRRMLMLTMRDLLQQ
eukprot:TRINITY_DN1133_c0_g1_i6.p1 TRINITY_DN1133_c0_g1~~TRINITY_DN1133_c0_g1_i6.p1  ORF type:complete len:761 (+),score=95.99 TRINITY_DN1133_c0_g1_i6:1-2283(+)